MILSSFPISKAHPTLALSKVVKSDFEYFSEGFMYQAGVKMFGETTGWVKVCQGKLLVGGKYWSPLKSWLLFSGFSSLMSNLDHNFDF